MHDHATLRRELDRIERLATLLDARYRFPGTGFRFGLDTIVGLIPGIGDTLTAIPSGWIIWKAKQLGVPRHKLMRMGLNTGADYVIGSIPILGDVADIGFKANLRNLAILREHLHERLGTVPPATGDVVA